MPSSRTRTHLLKYCDRVTLTRATVLEGAGTDDDPMRDVEYWYDDDGIQIARRDPVEDAAAQAALVAAWERGE